MQSRITHRAVAALAIAITLIGMAAGSASAEAGYVGEIVPPSSITIAGNTYPLGAPQDPPPPPGCGIPEPADPPVASTIDFEIDDSGDPHTVTADFEFDEGAANLPLLGWKRVLISGSGEGTIDPDTGEAEMVIDVDVEFQACDGGTYAPECTGSATVTMVGDVTPYPIVTGTSQAHLTGTGTLYVDSPPCNLIYVLGLNANAVTVDLYIDL